MQNGSGSAIAPMAHHLTTISPGAELRRTQNFHRGGVLVPGPAAACDGPCRRRSWRARVHVVLAMLASLHDAGDHPSSWSTSPSASASDLIHHPTLSSTRSTHRCAASRHRTRVLSPAPAATSAPACRADTRADTAGLTLLSPELMAGA